MTVTTYFQGCDPTRARDFSVYRITNDSKSGRGLLRRDNSGDINRPGLRVKLDQDGDANNEEYARQLNEFFQSVKFFAADGGRLPEDYKLQDAISRLFREEDADGWKVTAIDIICIDQHSVEFYLKNPLYQSVRNKLVDGWQKEGLNVDTDSAEFSLPTASIRMTLDLPKDRDFCGNLRFIITTPKESGKYPKHKWTEFSNFLGLPRIEEITSKHWKLVDFSRPKPRVNEDQDLPECSAEITEICF